MNAIRIRPYEEERDNDSLLAVAGNMYIPARVTLSVDRRPEFAAFSRITGFPFVVMVAEQAGEIIGFIEFALQSFSLFGEPTTGAHVTLAGVRPDSRRRGILTRLFDRCFDHVRTLGVDWAYTLVNARNAPIQRTIQRLVPGSRSLNRLLVHGLVFPMWPNRPRWARSYRIEQVGRDRWPEVLAFWQARLQQIDLAPRIEPDTWQGLPGAKYQVAVGTDGHIVATLGSWSSYAYKRTLVHTYVPWERRLFFHPLNSLLKGLGVRPFPKEGNSLRNLYGLRPMALPGQEAALGAMMHGQRRRARAYNLYLLAFPEDDPRDRLVKKYIRFTNVNIPMIMPLTAAFRERLQARPIRTMDVEYALV